MKQQITREQLNDTIITIYKKGGNVKDAEEYLTSIGRKSTIRNDIFQANQVIAERARLERESLVGTHVRRYEKIYEDHISKNFDALPAALQRYAKIDALIIALDALIAKEKVLGLHTKNFRVQLNNVFKKKIKQQYNFSSQNFEDLVKLKFLLEKMRVNKLEMQQTYFDDLENDTKDAALIKDVDYVEINEEAAKKLKEKVTPIKTPDSEPITIIQNVQQKIFENDLKKHDTNRRDFLKGLDDL